jgi:hypothetical protein
MILLNYAHPITEEQRDQLAALVGDVPEIREVATHIDRALPLSQVARELADVAGLSPAEWQTVPLLLNPPALAPVTAALLAELHGRCGYFVPVVHIRPVAGALPPRYEIGEIVGLQEIRDTARQRRV